MKSVSERHLLAGLSIAVIVLFVVSVLTGPARIGPLESLQALTSGGGEAASIILIQIRLPRALLAVLVGFSLAMSGAVLQGFLRNPLAEPGIVGISATASLGAVLTFYTGVAGGSMLALPAGALAGAGIAVVALLAISAGGSQVTLILGGVALTSLAGALTSLALNLSPNPFASYEIIFWLLGSMKDRSLDHVALAFPLMIAGWLLMLSTRRSLDALTLGEETAASLGVRMTRTRAAAVGGVALAVGAGTAVTGAIGFVGLVVPHLLRPFTDQRPGSLLLASGLGGAALLLAADIAARSLLPDRELNTGVVTALIGAPFFLWLVVRTRRELFA